MKADAEKVLKFLKQSDTLFIIPVYQREYSWKKENCLQLLQDIIENGKNNNIKEYFIGSIVYKITSELSTLSELTIIDGQQRITTISLLICALYRRYMDAGMTNEAKKLLKDFIINVDQDEESKIKLKSIREDDVHLQRLIEYIQQDDFSIKNINEQINGFSKIRDNFILFYNSIGSSSDDIRNIFNYMEKLNFVQIALKDGIDDAQKIFQSLNSTGLELTQADLIRNYILMNLPNDLQLKIYKNYWSKIEQNCIDVKGDSHVSDYIRDYMVFKTKTNLIPKIDEVYQKFKNADFITANNLDEALTDLTIYAKSYSKLLNPLLESNEKIRNSLVTINNLLIKVSFPFLMQVYNDYSDGIIDEDVFNNILDLVISYIWRRTIIALPSNALNKVFAVIYKRIRKDDYWNSVQEAFVLLAGRERLPHDNEIINTLENKDIYNIKKGSARYFLEQIENYGQKLKIPIDSTQGVTIEHIFPQVPNKVWKDKLSREDFDFMKDHCHTIANLTVSVDNSVLSNKSFKEKRDSEVGYKKSRFKMDKMLADFDEWNPENFKKRLDWICKKFVEIWKYPTINVSEEAQTQTESMDPVCKNVLDIDPKEIKSTKPIYYVFDGGERCEPRSWSSLHRDVATKLYAVDKKAFDNVQTFEIIPSDLKYDESKYMLLTANKYFLTGGISSDVIMKSLRKLFFDNDHTLEICYKYLHVSDINSSTESEDDDPDYNEDDDDVNENNNNNEY